VLYLNDLQNPGTEAFKKVSDNPGLIYIGEDVTMTGKGGG